MVPRSRSSNPQGRRHGRETDYYTRLVMDGARTSRQECTSHAGIGSREHEALEEVRISLRTSSTDKGEKLSSFTAASATSARGGLT